MVKEEEVVGGGGGGVEEMERRVVMVVELEWGSDGGRTWLCILRRNQTLLHI